MNKHHVVHILALFTIVPLLWIASKFYNNATAAEDNLYHQGLVVSHPAKKSIIQVVTSRHPLKSPIPSNTAKVIKIITKNCPEATLVVTKDGHIVAADSNIKEIITDDWTNPDKLSLKVGYVIYGLSLNRDVSLSVQYFEFGKLAPEIILTPHFIGGGLSYKLRKEGILSNTYLDVGGSFVGNKTIYSGISIKL